MTRFSTVIKNSAYSTALLSSSQGHILKSGGSIEKELIKAEVASEKLELKKALDLKKSAEKKQEKAHKDYVDATALVKKSNEKLVKAYSKK